MTQEDIAVFSDLDNPKVANWSDEQVSKGLEQLANDGFQHISPKNLGMYFLGNLAMMYPDSEYGNRMDLTQKIIASTLYSGDKLLQYFRETSLEIKNDTDAKEKEFQSKSYKITKYFKLIPERVKRALGFKGNYRGDYLNGDIVELKEVKEKRVLIDVSNKIADVVDEIINDFGQVEITDIIELVELNHFFSGEKNKTGQDITFTNPNLRLYGAKLQQQIHRAWYNNAIEDTPNPLSEEELFPRKK